MKIDPAISARLSEIGPVVLSNPWFGVGGLERVYLAVTGASPASWVVAAKNFHDSASFSTFFGSHKPFPNLFDIDAMVDSDSPLVYDFMANAMSKFYALKGHDFSAHVTNHWGLFEKETVPRIRKFIYFQPGVWEMEHVSSTPSLLERYRQELPRFPVLVNSKYMGKIVKDLFGCDYRVLYPCTDTEFFKLAGNNGPGARATRVVKPYDVMIFSRLNPGKNFSLALDIFSSIARERPSTTFLVAGAIRREEMSFLDLLRAQAREKGIESTVTFHPNPSLVELRDLYAKSKLLLFLTKNEPLGLVPVEAMCAGVPVVGFSSGGASETIIDGQNGLSCNDEHEMVTRMLDLLANQVKIDRLRAGATFVESRFSESTFLENLLALLRH